MAGLFCIDELNNTKTPLDSYRSEYWLTSNCFGLIGKNWMFRPVNLNWAGTKQIQKNPKIICFCHHSHSPPHRRSLPRLRPLPFGQSQSPHLLQLLLPHLFFSVLCFSSTFPLLCSLVFLVLNAYCHILFCILESHSHVNTKVIK